jgi:hypothetical protein
MAGVVFRVNRLVGLARTELTHELIDVALPTPELINLSEPSPEPFKLAYPTIEQLDVTI